MTQLEKAALDGERERATQANIKLAEAELRINRQSREIERLTQQRNFGDEQRIILQSIIDSLKTRGLLARIFREGE